MLRVPEGQSPLWRGKNDMVVGASDWLVIFSSAFRKQKERLEARPDCEPPRLTPSDVLPPAVLHHLKVPPPHTVGQVFNCMS